VARAKKRGRASAKGSGPAARFVDFDERFPAASRAYEALGEAIHAAGPLTVRERRLVKLAIAVGGRLEGAVKAHARRAARERIERAALDQVAVLAVTTVGLPTTVAALTWIEHALE
jgi:alkylhydroperoxidase/carboxymuconolactone decarboxylase family protein YurZ